MTTEFDNLIDQLERIMIEVTIYCDLHVLDPKDRQTLEYMAGAAASILRTLGRKAEICKGEK